MKLSNFFKVIFVVFLFALSFLFLSKPVLAQKEQYIPPEEKRLEAVVDRVKEERQINLNGKTQLYQKLDLIILKGDTEGKNITIENGKFSVVNVVKYKAGDRLIVTATKNFEGKEIYYITDYIRRTPLYLLFLIFVGLTIFIGRKRGVASLIGMVISFAVIFQFILPQILRGEDPVLISITASAFIVPLTFYLSHGLNPKTTAAVIGTAISLVITGVLASVFTESAKLSGFVSEEAGFLQVAREGTLNIRGLLLSGIIIGALGILDDIAISQSAIVYQMRKAFPTLSLKGIYLKAMDIGKDHIASTVNTLILVYTGAALPLLLLFINNPHPFSEVINYEIIAEEIVRTLVASIGLICAVPITTLVACFLTKKN